MGLRFLKSSLPTDLHEQTEKRAPSQLDLFGRAKICKVKKRLIWHSLREKEYVHCQVEDLHMKNQMLPANRPGQLPVWLVSRLLHCKGRIHTEELHAPDS